MNITRLILGPLQVNTYIVSGEGECLVVDPGDCTGVLASTSRLQCTSIVIAVTHGHFDHIAGVDCLVERARAILAAHPQEPRVAEASITMASMVLGLSGIKQESRPDIELVEGSVLEAAGLRLKVYHTPGHSPDHLVLHDPKARVAFVGDLVFQGSIGRVDIPGSNPQDMVRSINRVKSELDPETRLLPGHGDETTMRDELLYNPFLKRPELILEWY
ncbi:MAG: MBL fold metallo-hydrolase [Desulfurococcales archaeon]|nr:MBL fold metallo-hydrolase [Desulfurococcales archaeon]